MKEKQQPVWKVPWVTWLDFWKDTNIVGLCNAAHAQNGPRKVIWLVIFIGCTVGTIYNLKVFLENLYTTSTDVTVDSKNFLPFPGVTFCNHNRVNCAFLEDRLAQLELNITEKEMKYNPYSSLDAVHRMGCEENDPPSGPKKRRKRQVINQPMGGGQDGGFCDSCSVPEILDTEYRFLQVYMSLEEGDRSEIGHSFSGLVKSCTFRGRDCLDESYFLPVESANYGNCYTFNSNIYGNSTLSWTSSLPGANMGLNVVLNLEQDVYMKNGLTTSAGARVTVHNKIIRALSDEFGVDVQPATATNIAVQQIRYTRLADPYDTKCFSHWSETNYTDYTTTTMWPYTLTQCKRFCVLSSIVSDCGCFHPLYLDTDDDRKQLKPCDLESTSKDSTCVEEVLVQFDSNQRKCDCNPACTEIDFGTTLSMSTWPSMQYQNRAMGTYGFSTTTTDNETDSTTPEAAAETGSSGTGSSGTGSSETGSSGTGSSGTGSSGSVAKAPPPTMTDNLLRVSVYYNTLNERLVQTKKVYDTSNLLSSLGGVFSLYLGISFAMLFELLEIVLDFLHNIMNWMTGMAYGRKYHVM